MPEYSKGLEGVVAGSTAICTVGREGNDLRYRGYSIRDMKPGTRFEEIAHLLVSGRLPTKQDMAGMENEMSLLRIYPDSILRSLNSLPASTHPMDVLRTACSLLGCHDAPHPDPRRAFLRLLACLPDLLLCWHAFGQDRPQPVMSATTVSRRFLEGLHGRLPAEEDAALLDLSLNLYAEHEFNASTFAARTTASTLSDYYSAVTTAIGTLKGPLHGGANESAMEMLAGFKSVAEAKKWMEEAFARKAKIMGFGHRVYKVSDPRSDIIREHTRQLAEKRGAKEMFDIAAAVEQCMREQKKLFPNLDFYSALMYHLLGIPISLYTPLFVFSRLSGWTAHIIEQQDDNRIIRPTAIYTGPEKQTWIPLPQRK